MTFESKSIPCGIAGYDDFYSLADMVPLYRNGVVTTTTLFNKIASNWLKLEAINRVNTLQSYADAVVESAKLEATDAKAAQDYFNVDKSVDVVIFGHTHAPLLSKASTGSPVKIYANSGTWVDNNIDGDHSVRTYVKVVSSLYEDKVSLYSYQTDGTSLLKAE